jgi:Sigma-70, region 4
MNAHQRRADDDAGEVTLDDIARQLGISRSMVQIIEAQAMAKFARGMGWPIPRASRPWLQKYVDIALNRGRQGSRGGVR